MHRDHGLSFDDIVDAIERIGRYIEALDFDSFEQ